MRRVIVYPWPDYGILNLTTPLTEDQLVPLPSSVRVVQVQGPLDERGWIRLAAFLREYPSTGLSIGANFHLADLAFLRNFAFLRSLSVHAYGLTSFDGLELLDPRFLRRLSLGATASKAPSLALVARFTGLRALSIDGHVKGIDALTGLPNLRHLRLRSVRLPDLEVLTRTRQLETLELSLGGTTNLAALAGVPQLRALDLTMIRGLADCDVLGELRNIEYIGLRSLKHITRLPSLRAAARLTHVSIDQLRALTDTQAIADAPQLTSLSAVDMSPLQPSLFKTLVGHPTLRYVLGGFGSNKKNAQFAEMFAYLGTPEREPHIDWFGRFS